MATRIDWMGDMIGPVAVGVISAGAAVIEKQAVQRGTGGQFMRQASLWGDLLIGSYAIVNHMQDLRMPAGEGAKYTAGAGVALIAKRATDWIGSTVLQLPAFGRHKAVPGRRMPGSLRGRAPAAAVETGVLPRKRQFFSVV